MIRHDFRAVAYPLRLYSGRDALENLPAELKRRKSRRAFVVCGRSVSRKTDLVDRIAGILGPAYAGCYDEIEKDTTLASVQAAAAAARVANADMLIGVGAGSVIQGTRVVAILLAEQAPVEQLITQYPANAPAISPKLLAPKLPIINVLTAATTAQNRAGSAVKDPARPNRMEFFDPKTRPAALFWDEDALLTAPVSLARTTGTSVFWRAIMNLGAPGMAPLSEGDRLQAFRLARGAYPRMGDPADAAARIEMCAAAFLQNRDADDGGALTEKHWPARVTYALATALFNRHAHVGQGEANSALTATVIRHFGARDPEAMALIAGAFGVMDGRPPHERAAAAVEQAFAEAGMPARLRELDIPRDSLGDVLEASLKNFNADPGREFLRERGALMAALEAAW
ncbi:MAG: iron-containing alcohol dehydrogenase [Burkholderiales bacterium]|nr:iron-containing alcohol dehydrogenase [Burkholderiales bacterium]